MRLSSAPTPVSSTGVLSSSAGNAATCSHWMRRKSPRLWIVPPGPKVSVPTTLPWKLPVCARAASRLTPMTEALATLEKVTVRFEKRVVVDNVTLTVQRGDIITIIGPNGAGKTTLIKTVLGLQRATSGDRKSTRLNSSHVRISYAV